MIKRDMMVLFRRVALFMQRRLKIKEGRFRRNAAKLARAEKNGSDFVDAMPGIEMPMVIHPAMYLKKAYSEEIFEPDCLYFMRDSLRKGQTVMDVGANVGYFSLFASRLVGPTGKVLAFEPNQFACALLRRNKKMNGLSWLEVIEAGLGESDGTVPFNDGFPGMDVYSSRGEIRHRNANKSMFEKRDVQLLRGDNWVREQGVLHIDFMKIDTEGSEFFILKGFEEMFKTHSVSKVLIEISKDTLSSLQHSPIDILRFLLKYNYKWFELSSFGAIHPVLDCLKVEEGMYVSMPR